MKKISLKEVPIPQIPCPDVVPLNLAVPKMISFSDESSFATCANSTDSIGRCSTPTESMCFHCEHYHAEDCCLYFNDTDEDKPRYSRFKRNLEKPSMCGEKQQNFPLLPDAVSGNSTPPHFPSYTPADPMVFEEKIAKQQRTKTKQQQHNQAYPPQLSTTAAHLPLIYFRQFFYPYTSALQLTVNNLIQPQVPAYHQVNLQKQQIPPQLTPMTYHHYHQQQQQQQVPAILQPTPLFPTVYHHEYPHFMQQQQQQQTQQAPMTYINAGISYQSQIDLLNHPTLYYQHHHLPPMIPTGFY